VQEVIRVEILDIAPCRCPKGPIPGCGGTLVLLRDDLHAFRLVVPGYRAAFVGRPIVDDNDLALRPRLVQRRLNGRSNILLVVVAGNEN
jgi:hypothetical protein